MALVVKNLLPNAGDIRDVGLIPESGRYPGEGNRNPLQYSWGFPGDSDGKAPVCNVGDLGSIPGLGRSPGEGNAAHSSTLAWKISWTEEPGRLQSMGLQRVGHN